MNTDTLEDRIAHVLDTYTLEEVLELNDIPVHELVLRLVQDGTLDLPNVEPL